MNGAIVIPTIPSGIQLKAGEVAALSDSPTPAPPPPSAYVNTFTPNTDQISVNTGRAEVSHIENISSVFSTPPEMRRPEGPSPLVYLFIGFGIFYFLRKGF